MKTAPSDVCADAFQSSKQVTSRDERDTIPEASVAKSELLETSRDSSGASEPNDASVERALATALEAAAKAQRWDVVAQLAKELEARRNSDR